MDYKKMLLVEHLVNTIINFNSKTQYNHIFKMDNFCYVGQFFLFNEYNQPYVMTFREGWGTNKETQIFAMDNVNTRQQIRLAFFDYAFGEGRSIGEEYYKSYVANTDLAFRDIIEFVKEYEADFLNPSIKFPNCIYKLKNLDTGTEFDFYMLGDEEMTPVSLQSITKD